jgi:hypothetical protein
MMKRLYLMVAISSSLLIFTACSSTNIPTTEGSPTGSPKASNPLESATEQASKTAQSTLDKAKSAGEQATKTAQSTLDKAKSVGEQAAKTTQSTLDKTKSIADKVTQSTSEAVAGAMALKEGLQGMSAGVSNTLTAVNSSNFTAAQQEFSKLQGNWAKIGDTVKTKSNKTYQQINDQLNNVGTLLKEPQPERTKLVTELKNLGKTITNSLGKF